MLQNALRSSGFASDKNSLSRGIALSGEQLVFVAVLAEFIRLPVHFADNWTIERNTRPVSTSFPKHGRQTQS